MRINEIAKDIHGNNKIKGFWDSPRNNGEMLMLVVSELSEALEADREGRYCLPEDVTAADNKKTTEEFVAFFKENVKDTYEDELADAVIRIFDMAHARGMNLEAHIRTKVRYNRTRERMHGKKY